MRVLSVGHMTFSSDQRYQVIQVPRQRLQADDWNLEVNISQKFKQLYDPNFTMNVNLMLPKSSLERNLRRSLTLKKAKFPPKKIHCL